MGLKDIVKGVQNNIESRKFTSAMDETLNTEGAITEQAIIDTTEVSKDSSKEAVLENIIVNAIKIPGVKVDRKAFLSSVFVNENVNLQEVLEYGPVKANCSQKMLANIANKHILLRTSESSALSFAAGLPGGFTMAATIPADTLQYFGMALRLAQELTYLYGAQDLWQNGEVDSTSVQNQLILYCGVMFGVSGASAGVRLLTAQVAKQALKKIPQKALTKTIWYPIVKQIGKVIGVKITKDTVAKGASKVIPIVGGVISGGITFMSMRPMGARLAKTLDEAIFDYNVQKFKADYAECCEMSGEEYSDVEMENSSVSVEKNGSDVFEKIEKLAKLKEIGAITPEEYDAKKTELLELI